MSGRPKSKKAEARESSLKKALLAGEVVQNYTRQLTILVAATAIAGLVISVGIYFGVTSTYQGTVATIVVAFAGFIFGGLYPFVLEGRRMPERDRSERTKGYHKKLKERVFDFWTGRTVEPRMKMNNLPDSRESLYVFLDLGSDGDPDQRYLESSLSHLKVKLYKDTAMERESILSEVKTHNEKAEGFVKSNASIFEKGKSLELTEVNVNPSDKLENTGEVYNRVAVLDFLDNSFDYPSDTRLKTEGQLGGFFLKYDRQTLTYTLAHSLKEERIQALSDALSEFASKYLETRHTLRSEISSLETHHANPKNYPKGDYSYDKYRAKLAQYEKLTAKLEQTTSRKYRASGVPGEQKSKLSRGSP
jgi:hypothetical protein